ncbi:MAG: hypothetical protein ABIO70_06095 [Pseudomonadota bacterium]
MADRCMHREVRDVIVRVDKYDEGAFWTSSRGTDVVREVAGYIRENARDVSVYDGLADRDVVDVYASGEAGDEQARVVEGSVTVEIDLRQAVRRMWDRSVAEGGNRQEALSLLREILVQAVGCAVPIYEGEDDGVPYKGKSIGSYLFELVGYFAGARAWRATDGDVDEFARSVSAMERGVVEGAWLARSHEMVVRQAVRKEVEE